MMVFAGAAQSGRPPLADAPACRWLALLASLALSGCGAGTEAPDAPLPPAEAHSMDAAAISSRTAVLGNALNTRAMTSLAVLGPLMFLTPLSHLAAPSSDAGSCLTTDLAAPGVHVVHRPPELLLADSLKRRSFVIDPVRRAWVWLGDSSGPADGVRFNLPEVDDLGGVRNPVTATGEFELRDAGGDTLAARLEGTRSSYADYRVSVMQGGPPFISRSAGTLRGASAVFAWQDSVAEDGLHFHVGARLKDLTRGGSLQLGAWRSIFDAADNRYDFDFALLRDGDTVQLIGSVDTYCFFPTTRASVLFNGSPVAEIHGAPGNIEVLREDGSALEGEERGAMLDLLAGQKGLYEALAALYAPVGQLLRSGVVGR